MSGAAPLIPPTFLDGVERDNFTFSPLGEYRDSNLTFKYATDLSSQILPHFLTLNIFLFDLIIIKLYNRSGVF